MSRASGFEPGNGDARSPVSRRSSSAIDIEIPATEEKSKRQRKEREKGEKAKAKGVPNWKAISQVAADWKSSYSGKEDYRIYGVDTFGVVMSFTHPKLLTGKGAQYNKYGASYFLADPSQKESFEANVNLNIFRNTLDEFPHIRSVGDILICQKVNAQYYNGLQLIAPKNYGSFAVFHRKFDPT